MDCIHNGEKIPSGGSDVLGPAESVGAGGIGSPEDAGAVGNGAMTARAMDSAI